MNGQQYSGQGGTTPPSPSPKRRGHGCVTVLLVCIVASFAIVGVFAVWAMITEARYMREHPGAAETEPSAPSSITYDADAVQKLIDQAEKDYKSQDLPDVPHEWTLTAGNYLAGAEIPSGRINLTALSGSGNVVGGDFLEGGINEVMSADSSDYGWTSTFHGLELLRGDMLSITSDLVLSLEYSQVWYGLEEFEMLEDKAVDLGPGNYTLADLPYSFAAYDVTALSGSGNFYGGDLFEGGVNATMSADSDWPGFIDRFHGFELEDGESFSITGDLVLRFVPYIFK